MCSKLEHRIVFYSFLGLVFYPPQIIPPDLWLETKIGIFIQMKRAMRIVASEYISFHQKKKAG